MMQALGATLRDANGTEMGYGGGSLMALNSVDLSGLDARLKDCTIHVACDVTNPLVGERRFPYLWPAKRGDRGDDPHSRR